jgi:hypothetical protein
MKSRPFLSQKLRATSDQLARPAHIFSGNVSFDAHYFKRRQVHPNFRVFINHMGVRRWMIIMKHPHLESAFPNDREYAG